MLSKLQLTSLIRNQKRSMVRSDRELFHEWRDSSACMMSEQGMTRVFTSRTIPCTNPSLIAGNSSTSVSPFYRALKCTRQVFQFLARFVS